MKYFLLFLIGLAPNFTSSQSTYFTVNNIHIKGNNKTKDRIIHRELDLKEGDTIIIKDIAKRILENEKRILNTGLFTDIKTNIVNWDFDENTADIEINLRENWYIYPAPIFELADRNFNVWWNEQNKSLSRVNFGLRVSHINLTGNKDYLKLVTQFGYTKKYEADYNYPYLNNNKNLGLGANIFFTENKEMGYATRNNKTLFYKAEDERILLRRFRIGTRLHFRPDLFQFHLFKVEYHRNSIDESIATEFNPDYFLDGRTELTFIKLEYDYAYDRRIFKLYPQSGFRIGANLRKEGLGIFDDYNSLQLSGIFDIYGGVKDKFIIGWSAKARIKLLEDQIAFANNTGLGYGTDVVTGYELYVIDGKNYFINKASAKYKIFSKNLNLNKAMPLQQLRYVSLRVYFTLNLDSGYVSESSYLFDNDLNNRWIYGYGPGLDFIIYNTYLFQIKYSVNHLGEKGIYFSNKTTF